MSPESALILGGGVCGLAAAYRLLQLAPGCRVTVLEAGPRTGGLAASWRCDEFSADLGPHRVYTELPEIEALLPELIARDEEMTVTRRSQLLLGGHMYRYPVRPAELLRVMGPVRMGALGFSAVAGKVRGLARPPRNYEDAMVAAFGRGVYDLIIAPYTRKVWKTDPAGLHAEVARVRVSAGGATRMLRSLFARGGAKTSQTALSHFTYIRGGAEGLVRSLQRKVEELGGVIETGCRVEGLDARDGRVTGVRPAGGGPARTADMVISTIPVTDLVGHLGATHPDADAASAAGGLDYLGLVLAGIVLRRGAMSPNCWLYFPEDGIVFNRAYEPRNFDPGMAPEGRTMVVFEVTARWDDPLWTAPADDTAQAVLADALRLGLFARDEVENVFALKVKHTYPLYRLDYAERLGRVHRYLAGFRNLLSTGRQGLFNHNNMDHSMLVGMRAAELAVSAGADGDAAARWYAGLGQFAHFRIVD